MPTVDTLTTKFDFKADTGNLKKIENGLEKVESKLSAIAGGMAKVGTAFAALAGVAVKSFSDIEEKQSKLVGLVGLTVDEAEAVTGKAKELAQTFGVATDEIQDAAFTLASSGQRGATLMDSITAAAKGAAAGLGDVAEVANAVAKSMNNWSESGLVAEQVISGIIETAKIGLVDATQLATQYANLGSVMNLAGVSFQETSGFLAKLSLNARNAGHAGTMLNGVMRLVLRPTKLLKEAYRELGVTKENVTRKIAEKGGLLEFLKEVQVASGKIGKDFASLFTNVEGKSAISILFSDLEDTQKFIDQTADSTGELHSAWQAVEEDLGVMFRKFKESTISLSATLGEALAPTVKDVGNKVIDVVNAVDQLISQNPWLGRTVGTFVGMGAALLPLAGGLKLVSIALNVVRAKALAAGAAMTGVTLGLSIAIPAVIALFNRWQDHSKKMEEQALETAIKFGQVDTKINELKESFINGKISADEFSDSLETINTKLAEMKEETVNAESEIHNAKLLRAVELRKKLDDATDKFNRHRAAVDAGLGAGFGPVHPDILSNKQIIEITNAIKLYRNQLDALNAEIEQFVLLQDDAFGEDAEFTPTPKILDELRQAYKAAKGDVSDLRWAMEQPIDSEFWQMSLDMANWADETERLNLAMSNLTLLTRIQNGELSGETAAMKLKNDYLVHMNRELENTMGLLELLNDPELRGNDFLEFMQFVYGDVMPEDEDVPEADFSQKRKEAEEDLVKHSLEKAKARKKAFDDAKRELEEFNRRVEATTSEIMFTMESVVRNNTSVADAFRQLGIEALFSFGRQITKEAVSGLVSNAMSGLRGGGLFGSSGGGVEQANTALIGAITANTVATTADATATTADVAATTAQTGSQVANTAALATNTGALAANSAAQAAGGVGGGIGGLLGGLNPLVGLGVGLLGGSLLGGLFGKKKKRRPLTQYEKWGNQNSYAMNQAIRNHPHLGPMANNLTAGPGSSQYKALSHGYVPSTKYSNSSTTSSQVDNSRRTNISKIEVKIDGAQEARKVAEEVGRLIHQENWDDARAQFESSIRL